MILQSQTRFTTYSKVLYITVTIRIHKHANTRFHLLTAPSRVLLMILKSALMKRALTECLPTCRGCVREERILTGFLSNFCSELEDPALLWDGGWADTRLRNREEMVVLVVVGCD